MMSKGKKNKSASKSKRPNRRVLSFYRVLRYGFDSFIRNSWLSVAATAVMTITLIVIFTAFVSQNILSDTVGTLRYKVDLSIYLKTETTSEQGQKLIDDVKQLSSVIEAKFTSASEAKKIASEANKDQPDYLEAINEATNKMPASLDIVVKDVSNTVELEEFIKREEVNSLLNADHKPSFQGEKKAIIENIGRAASFAQKVGIAASTIFVVISSLIIFNTIRMAIFNRKEEIQMMKLIGADRSFIRGPFIVESIMYGVIAALFAVGLGMWGLYSVADKLASYQITVQPTLEIVTLYAVLVVPGMMTIGAVIGIISSMLATHKYLKI